MSNRTWAERDLAVVWHPCTQMHDHKQQPPVPIRRGSGVWLEDFEGHRFIDGISSWWVNLFGHAHPAMNQAISRQMDQLEHVLLAGFTHEPVIRLSEELVRRAPAGLTHCFYADSGSAAVEIALKMSLQYWRNLGYPDKIRFLSLQHGYHGETLGALALSDLGLYRAPFDPVLPVWRRVASPACPGDATGSVGLAQAEWAAEELERVLIAEAAHTAAFILEPLVQCAGGMRMHHPHYLARARALCTQYGLLLIADEVAVGFGRTGTVFACAQGGITPDLLCLGKGLSGGYLPLSVCLSTDTVYAAFYAEDLGQAFLHSHSFTGNALGCAAGLASLALLDHHLPANQAKADRIRVELARFENHPHVTGIRQTGLIAALDLVRDPSGTPYPTEERRGRRACTRALNAHALLRPLGDTLYLMPPYVISDSEITLLVDALEVGISYATAE